MEFKDREIKCKFCDDTFTWPAEEQEKGYELGLELDEIRPEYCEDCLGYLMRKHRRQQEKVRGRVEVSQ